MNGQDDAPVVALTQAAKHFGPVRALDGALADDWATNVHPLYQKTLSAAVAGHDDVVRELLEHGADAAAADEYGKTALHQCSLFCSPPVIEALVAAAPASRAALDRDGNTAHDMAKMSGRRDAVLQLLLPPPGGVGGDGQQEEL